jgi:hypothetical protein
LNGWKKSAAYNGGGRRIRTFEVDDGRFTVCSLWPLGNPARDMKLRRFRHRMDSDGGGRRIRTFEVDDGRFTVCSLWPLGNPATGLNLYA